MNTTTTSFNRMQELKRRFFAMRNGAVADSLRRQGAPYRIIFGLNLPQLVEIARDFGPDAELANSLRENLTTRESLLIAPMLYPVENLTAEKALKWLTESPTTEVVDVVCLKLVRHMPGAPALVELLACSAEPLHRYAALRLGANLLPQGMDKLEVIARREISLRDPMTLSAATIILDDISWRKEVP